MKTDGKIDPFEVLLEAHTGQLVIHYIVVAETMLADGSKNIFIQARPGQSAMITVGLLESMSACEKARIARHMNTD
jgi:hypothetical protein